MRKRMKRYLSLCLTLCMLVMALPPISLAEDGTAPVATAEQAAVLEPQAAAGAADVTPAAAAAPDPAGTPETTPDPDAASEPDAVLQAEPDATPDPDATVEPDAASEPDVVLQAEPDATPDPDATAVPDADAAPEDDATPDPDATPEPEGSAAPSTEPTLVSSEPTPVGIEELPPLEEEATVDPAMLEAAEITITNTYGVLSYAVPEGVTVEKQQWRKNSTDIAGATDATYTLTMDDMKNKDNVLSVRLILEDGSEVTSVGYAMSTNNQWSLDNGDLRFTNDYDQNTTSFPIDNNGIGITNLHVYVEPGVSVSGVTLTCQLLTNENTITDSTLEIKEQLFNLGTIYGCEFLNSGRTRVTEAGTIHVPVTINGTVYKSKPGDSLQFLYGENTHDALESWYEANFGTYEPEYVRFLYNDGQNTRVNGDMLLGLSNSFNVPYCTIEAPNGFVSGATVRASVQPAIYDSLYYTWFAGSTKLSDGSTAVLPDIDPGASAKIELYVTLHMTIDGAPEVDCPIHATAYFSGMAQAEGVLPVITNTNGTLSYSCTLPEGVSVEKQQWLKNGSPISGATDETYTLTMDDMKNRNNVLSVQLILSNSTVATSEGYAMSANDEWELEDDHLAFTGSYDQKTTDFPLKLENTNLENVGVESGASVSGVNLSCNQLTNQGTISNCTLQIRVDSTNYGTISGSGLTVGESLGNYGTISGSSLTVNGGLGNSGVIYKSGIDCSDVDNENGVIHVRVTINGEDCSSTPDTSWQFLYGATALDALNAWYADQHPGASTDGLRWVLVVNDMPYPEVNDFELQYYMQYNFVCLRCSIEAPDGLLAGSTVYAGLEAPEGYTANYTWYHDGEQFATGDEAVLPQLKAGASATVELQVSNIKTSDGNSVAGGLSASATFSGVAYDVKVDYENDSLVITPRDGVTIDGALVQVGNSQFGGVPVDGTCTLPLSYFGDESFDASLYVYNNDSGQLAGPTSLHLSRAAANVDPTDFSVTVAESTNSDGTRDVAVRWDSASTLDFRLGTAGKIYKGKSSGDTIPVSGGANVTLYARIPGSADDKKLPSQWVEVGSIDARDWLYLNVSSQRTLGRGNALFWGEVLKIETNLSAAELKWTVNGAAVDPPTLDGGLYTIPANVSSLSVTATDGSGSITRELSVSCPVSVRVDLASEEVVLQRVEGCTAEIGVHLGGEGATGDGTLNDGGEKRWPVTTADSAQMLLIDLSYGNASCTIQQTLPARFAGQVIEGSVTYKRLNSFDFQSKTWGCTGITTQDGDGVAYAAVKLVGPSLEKIFRRDDTDKDKWVPADSAQGLIVGSTYSIYARQCSVDAAGKQNSFASDWFDTGVRIKAGEIELSTYAPLVGDTVTATEKFLHNDSFENPPWHWAYCTEGESEIDAGVTESNSFTILPGSGYENRRLTVKFGDNNYSEPVLMGYAETEVIPEAQIIIRREDGTELKKDASGNYIAYLGDKLTAEVKNVSPTFLKNADEVEWTWESVGPAGSFTTGTSSLELDKDLFRGYSCSDVSVVLRKGTDEINLKRRVKIYVAPAPDVQIDYENETLYAVKPDNAAIANYGLCVLAEMLANATDPTGDADGRYTIKIDDVTSGWPDSKSHNMTVYWAEGTFASPSPKSEGATLTIPARPAVNEPDTASAPFAITVEGVSLADYEMKLVAKGGAVTDESVGTVVEDANNGVVRFTGLESLKEYRLWMRKKATDSAFRSEWTSFDVGTRNVTELVPGLTWTASYDPKGFSLSADDVLNHVSFTNKSTGKNVMIPVGSVTLTRADGKPFPITDAGTYSLKLTLTGAITDNYRLSTDIVTLTVQPYEVQAYSRTWQMPYKAAEYSVYDYEIKVEDVVLTDKDYEVALNGDAKLLNAGEYTGVVTFKGNYVAGQFLDTNLDFGITPMELRATAAPAYASRVYDGSTAVECAADWRSPFEGDDVVVKAVGTMENKDAGTGKSVAITLWLEGAQSGNYVLNSTSQTGSVDIEKKEIALRPEQPADFAYTGDTAVPLTREGWTLEGVLTGDDAYVDASGASATVEDPNAGENKAVSFTGWQLAGADKENYLIGSVEARSVSITKAKAPAINWPTAGDICYGQSLADSVLSHTRDENGAFAWDQPEYVPTQADEWGFTMIYTPDDTANYAYEEGELRRAINIRVNKAAAPEIQWPSASAIRFGQSLADSVLTGNDLHGSFAWVNPNERPNAGRHSFPVRYTPDDVKNYDYSGVTLERDIAVTVLPADAPVILWPSASDITYGESLRASVLTSADANGSFAWKNPDEQPNAGTAYCVVVYTPDNANDYDYGPGIVTVEQAIPVTVHKAQSVIDVSGVVTQYSYTGEKQTVDSGATLNHSECALIYSNNSFTTVAEGDGLTVKISAAETANHLAAETEVTIHVAKAEAPRIILPAASGLTYGQKLSESALSGGEDAPGSFAWENGDVLLPAGVHSCNVVFTPDDPDNYTWTQESLVQRVEVIVNRKPVRVTVENASKTYGDADPKAKVSVSGVLEGDSLVYSVSRRSGEDVGQYAYIVEPGSNPNYMPDVLLGTLTIAPRSIADGSVSISAVGRQTCTGREIKPEPKLHFGGAALVQGRDYVLSYSNNVRPGCATITVTGKGNFSGACDLDFRIVEASTATPTQQPASVPAIEPVRDEALQNCLDGMASLVFDADYAPVDFVQIPLLLNGEEQEGVLLICASREESGEAAQRSLILNAAQLVRLRRMLEAYGIGDLIFENGGAAARMNLEALTGGNMAKLMARILSGEEITEEILESDWSALEDAALSEAAYERFNLEVRIAPVVQEDGGLGHEITVWLRYDRLELNVSGLIDGLNVLLDAQHLVTEENADAFEELYAVAREFGEETELLDSTLVLAPTASVDGSAETTPTVSERYALTALHAGNGAYRLAETERR